MTKNILIISLALLALSCSSSKKEGKAQKTLLSENSFKAVPMPDKLITGNSFPTDSSTINSWVSNSSEKDNLETNANIINHGWAVWVALTEMTDQTSNGQALRRFETWYTPGDIISAGTLRKTNSDAKLHHVPRNTGKLVKPHQFHANPADGDVVSFVKYDPTAAQHAYDNNLFYESTLKSLLKQGQIANIPDFPASGITLKPVFYALNEASKDPSGKYYTIPVWPGDGGDVERPFGSDKWNNNILITIDGETDAANHIYSINDFIHFKLDSAQASSIIMDKAKPGDYAVLQGMHVTTREIKRWTWQTFWWSENNDQPFSPSSTTIAGLRPTASLDQGANHYAMATAYNMVIPSQPYYNGSGANAKSLYAYNPYLEAGFDTTQFTAGNDSVRNHYSKDYQLVGGKMNSYGMQTNCMSCHSQARYMKGFGQSTQLYLSDQYVDLDAPYFKNAVKLDFAWSILGNMVKDE